MSFKFPYAAITKIRIKKWKAAIIESSKAEHSKQLKSFVLAFICLSFSLLMHRMLSVDNLSWKIAAL